MGEVLKIVAELCTSPVEGILFKKLSVVERPEYPILMSELKTIGFCLISNEMLVTQTIVYLFNLSRSTNFLRLENVNDTILHRE